MNKNNILDGKWLYVFAVFLSLLLSLHTLVPYEPINPDGMTYLKTALLYQEQGFAAAMQVYPWPFYSILVAYIAKFSHLSLLSSFYAVNFSLQALLALTYMLVVKELGAEKNTLFWAAIVILIFPFLSHYRDQVIRDFGYWAFGLWSLVYLLRYSTTRSLSSINLFYVLMFIAALFRIEGLVMLVLLPLPLMIWQSKQVSITSGQNLARMLLLPFVITLVFVGLYFLAGKPGATHLGRVDDIYNQIINGYHTTISNVNTAAQAIELHVLNPDCKGGGKTIIWSGLLALWLIGLIHSLRWPDLILSLIGQSRDLIRESLHKHVLYWAIIVNLVMLAYFTAQRFFLMDRYAAFFALVMLLWVPFAINDVIFYRNYNVKSRAIFGVAVAFIIYMAIGAVGHFGVSKHYIYEAAHWSHDNLPKDLPVITNDKAIEFYLTQEYQNLARMQQVTYVDNFPALKKQHCRSHYIVWQIDKRDSVPSSLTNQSEWFKVFNNKRGDRVIVQEACV